MSNNVQAESVVSAGSRFVTAEVTAYGDASSHIPGCFMAIVSGSEGSQTFAEVVGGAGAVSAGVQRVTLASDDPAVVALQILDNAISGSEMQVDVVGALPAGTNAIGKLAANSGVDIGDVDVTSIIPGTGATNLGKAIDTATGATDTGVLALATRDDALSALTPVEGDNVQLRTDANGALWVIQSGSVTVGTIATSVTPGTSASHLGKAEDAAHSSGDVGVMSLSVRQDTAAALSGTDGDYQPLITDASGRLHVNVGNSTIAVTQSGTWNVGAISTSVTPGTGAANLGKAEDAAHSSGDTGVFILAVRSDTAAATGQTDGDYTALVTDSTGRLHVNVGNTVTVASHAVTIASGGIASGAVASGAIASGAVASGAFASGALASGSIASGAIADMIVDDAAFTPATSRVLMAGFEADESSTDSVDEGDAGAARMTLDRKLIVTPLPHTAGGCSIFRTLDLDETEEDVKTSAGQIYGIFAINTTNAALYLKIYNATAANVTVGSTTPVLTFVVPGNNDTDGAGFYLSIPTGVAFDTAISAAATTGLADADTGAPGANALVVNIFYK